jgi:hypothetical protein
VEGSASAARRGSSDGGARACPEKGILPEVSQDVKARGRGGGGDEREMLFHWLEDGCLRIEQGDRSGCARAVCRLPIPANDGAKDAGEFLDSAERYRFVRTWNPSRSILLSKRQ